MSARWVAYIDESGDEGFSFDAGSSAWFVLSAVIASADTDREFTSLLASVRETLGKPLKKALHFRDLRHEQRVPYLDRISKMDLTVTSVIIDKRSLVDSFRRNSRLYFYSARYLLERVSWLCRDQSGRGKDCTTDLVFSNRAGMSYDDLRAYLQNLQSRSDVKIAWEAIDCNRIVAHSAGKKAGLQIADAVASSMYYAVQRNRYGFIEDRYVNILRPVIYKRSGNFLSYGLKFFPAPSADLEWVSAYR